MNEPAWFSVNEAAHYCALSKATIDREIRRGNIKSKLYTTGNGRHGRKRRLVSRASMDNWIESLPDAGSRLN